MPKILVTGGAGFIGSTVADLFAGAGWDVAVLDDLSSGKRENVPAGARFYPCDVRSEAAAEAVRKERPQVLCHHAAQIDVRRSMADPRHDLDVNLGGLLNVVQAAAETGVEHVLFASSGGAMYGETDRIPTPEDQPPQPVSHYGAAKAASELYLGVFRAAHGIPFTALRYGNVYGPRQDPHGEAGVVAIFCGRLLDGEPCTVYGDGTQTRSLCYVDDTVRALVGLLDSDFTGAMNVGNPDERTVMEIAKTVIEITGSASEIVFEPLPVDDPARRCPDVSLARRVLGWTPEVDLRTGLTRLRDWYRSA